MDFGGRYVARGGQVDVVEGERPQEQKVIVVEFPSMARVCEWYSSSEYAEALAVRDGALTRRLTFVEGVADH